MLPATEHAAVSSAKKDRARVHSIQTLLRPPRRHGSALPVDNSALVKPAGFLFNIAVKMVNAMNEGCQGEEEAGYRADAGERRSG